MPSHGRGHWFNPSSAHHPGPPVSGGVSPGAGGRLVDFSASTTWPDSPIRSAPSRASQWFAVLFSAWTMAASQQLEVGNAIAEELALVPSVGAVVPAESSLAGDGDAVEGGMGGEFAAEGVDSELAGAVRVAPPVERHRPDAPIAPVNLTRGLLSNRDSSSRGPKQTGVGGFRQCAVTVFCRRPTSR